MIEPIIQFFEKLITQFSWKRLFFVIVVVLSAISILAWYETYTGHFRLSRIEKSTELLSRLVDLSGKIKETNDEKIYNIFLGLTKDLEMYVNYTQTPFNIHPSVLKIIAASFPWILMITIFFLNGYSFKSTYIGIIIAAVPFIAIGGIMPTYQNQYINYLFYPIAHFAVINISVFVLYKLSEKRRKNTPRRNQGA